jgi:hypothetical protein
MRRRKHQPRSLISVALLIASSSFISAQTTTGNARATGTCAVSHSGNNDTIIITDCGIGKEEADKITAILQAVLANQEEESRDAKLDELLDFVKRAVDPYRSVLTYAPDGHTRKVTPSTGEYDYDLGGFHDFQAMDKANQAKDWQSLKALAQKALEAYPGWFTPRLFLGLAQINLCQKEDGQANLKRFLDDTKDAEVYAHGIRQEAQHILASTATDDYKRYCAQKSGGHN